MKQFTRPNSTITQLCHCPASRQKLGLHRSTQLGQAHNNILSSQRALSNHILSSESRNISLRTVRWYTLGKSNNRTYLTAQNNRATEMPMTKYSHHSV